MLSLFYYCVEAILRCLQKFVRYSQYIIVEYTPSLILLYIVMAFFRFIIFAFTYMCIHYLGHLPSLPTLPPGRTYSLIL
jgi:hypothetical protein